MVDADLGAVGLGQFFDLESDALEVEEVHAHEHLGPVVGLGAAVARGDGEVAIAVVVLAAGIGQPAGRGGNDPAEGVGHTAGLFLNQSLLEKGVARPSQLGGLIDGQQSQFPGPGQVVVRSRDLALDPHLRPRMNAASVDDPASTSS